MDFDATFGDLAPYLDFHGFADAKVAHSQSYPTDANWKLSSRTSSSATTARRRTRNSCSMHPPRGAGRLRRRTELGTRRSGGQIPADAQGLGGARGGSLGRPLGTVDDGPESSHLRLLLQRTIREGYESETQDGRPASSLMGKRLGFDQGRMYLSFSPFTQLVATNDFAVLFLFTPRSTITPTWICSGWSTARRPTSTWSE